ncbi:MAG: cadherin domain-containing protein, partial [Pirellulaceae bacterium]
DFVLENAANGTAVGVTALADDPDGTDTVSYALDDDAGGRFAIQTTTGVVTVAGGINREAAGSYDITVRATSSDTTTTTRTFTIAIGDVDEFDVGAISDTNVLANAVDENAANGTVVAITAAASDADATTNAITYTLDDSGGGRFAIHSSTGIVTVADGTLLNREAAASHDITVRATSADGSSSTQTFTINVNDVDEFDVGAVTDVNAAANTVAENASVGTAVGLTGLASDADATATIAYSLDDDAGGLFAIHATTGVVTVNAALDYETAISHSVTIRATSSDGSFATQSFTIAVTDVNDNAPVAAADQYTVTQAESLVVLLPGFLANDLDVDGDVLTALLVTNVAHGSLALNSNGSFTYVPAPTFSGTEQFTYVVTDGNLSSDAVTVTIVVEGVASDDGGDDRADPAPPPDEESDDEDVSPDEVVPPPSDEDLPSIVPPRGHEVERPVSETTPPVHVPDDRLPPVTRDDSVNSTGPGLLDAVLWQSTALTMTEASSPRNEARVANEPTNRFVSEIPLTVAFASSHDSPSEETGVLSSEQLVLGTTTAAATAFSVGYIVWLIRGGSLFASLLASLPAWSAFDPLPILDSSATSDKEDDDERLQDIVA